ncbi:hypothetical protein VNO77_34407 [Canavalia gladiata]|uniref:Uncharacterized protein n=1 Tax=Canavalia gladiata TaxID=3824 RepID=A0AAN9PZS0_CANGL
MKWEIIPKAAPGARRQDLGLAGVCTSHQAKGFVKALYPSFGLRQDPGGVHDSPTRLYGALEDYLMPKGRRLTQGRFHGLSLLLYNIQWVYNKISANHSAAGRALTGISSRLGGDSWLALARHSHKITLGYTYGFSTLHEKTGPLSSSYCYLSTLVWPQTIPEFPCILRSLYISISRPPTG